MNSDILIPELERMPLQESSFLLENYGRKICISSHNEITIVPIINILRCESKSNYTTVFLRDNTKLLASKPLCDFENLLTEYNFCRVHNSHLVNLAFVKNFKKGDGYCITMSDDTEIAVSTRKKEFFLSKLKEVSCAIL
jgi:two-component system, LytTR family, response regulator